MTFQISRKLVGAALLSLSLFAAPAVTAEILVSPDNLTTKMLLARLSGSVPNFEQMAMQTAAYRQADEFTRHEGAET